MLNVEENEYIESADASDLGFMLEIHDQNQPPLVTEFGFGVTSGFHYLIAMKMQEVREQYTSTIEAFCLQWQRAVFGVKFTSQCFLFNIKGTG